MSRFAKTLPQRRRSVCSLDFPTWNSQLAGRDELDRTIVMPRIAKRALNRCRRSRKDSLVERAKDSPHHTSYMPRAELVGRTAAAEQHVSFIPEELLPIFGQTFQTGSVFLNLGFNLGEKPLWGLFYLQLESGRTCRRTLTAGSRARTEPTEPDACQNQKTAKKPENSSNAHAANAKGPKAIDGASAT